MISRHLLRIKILQILFAHYRNGASSTETLNKELTLSVEKSYQLYHLLLQLPVEIADYAQTRIDIGKQKLLPTPEEKNPNTRFVDNLIIKQLGSSIDLRDYLDTNRLNWRESPELVKVLYNRLRETDSYKAYMESETSSIEDDKQMLSTFILKELDGCDDFVQFLEEKSIYWNDDIDLVASMASKTIKKMSGNVSEDVPIMPMFRNSDDEDFARKLLRKVILRHTENIALIDEFTKNWEVDRIANMDILIMEMAITEILEFPSVPVKVSLNEYIEIVKYYSTDQSSTFVNGVLDKVIASLREKNLIVKQGRGLMGDDDVRLNQ